MSIKNTGDQSAEQKDEQKTDNPVSKDQVYEKWKDPAKNRAGNDITGDMKIANSNGEMEGGTDKRWHLEEDDQ